VRGRSPQECLQRVDADTVDRVRIQVSWTREWRLKTVLAGPQPVQQIVRLFHRPHVWNPGHDAYLGIPRRRLGNDGKRSELQTGDDEGTKTPQGAGSRSSRVLKHSLSLPCTTTVGVAPPTTKTDRVTVFPGERCVPRCPPSAQMPMTSTCSVSRS